jgi:hypothetical protein
LASRPQKQIFARGKMNIDIILSVSEKIFNKTNLSISKQEKIFNIELQSFQTSQKQLEQKNISLAVFQEQIA